MFNAANNSKTRMNFGSMSRPILRFLQVTGVYPISIGQNVYTFSWLSRETIYAYLSFFWISVATVLAAIPLIERVFDGEKTAMISVFELFAIMPNIIMPIVGIASTKSLALYLDGWSSVNTEFLSVIGKSLSFSHSKFANRALLCGIIIQPIIFFCKFTFGWRFPVLEILANEWPDVLNNSLAVMWHVQAGLIATAFQELGDNFSTMMWSWSRSDPTVIRRYRLLYARMTSLTSSFEESMNLVTTVTCLNLIVKMIFYMYGILVAISRFSPSHRPIGEILTFTVVFIYSLMVLLIICKAGEKIAMAGGLQFAEKLCALTPQLSAASRSEFKLFMDTVYFGAPKPTLAEIARIDLGLITTTCNIILGYFVIFYQIIDVLK